MAKKTKSIDKAQLSNVPTSIAFQNTKPWHGFGSEIEPGESIHDTMKRAGLDFQVALSPIHYGGVMPAEETPDENPLADGNTAELPPYFTADRRALYRTDDGTLFDTPRTGYYPIQNREIVELFEEYVKAGDMRIETMGSFGHGLKNWLLVDMDMGFDASMDVGGDPDLILGKILCYFSFVYGEGAFHKTTSISVVCSNTLEAAKKQESKKYRLWHNVEWNSARAAEAKLNLEESRTEFARLKEDARILTKVKLSVAEASVITAITVGKVGASIGDQPRAFGKVMDLWSGQGRGMSLPSRNGTAWGLLNAHTEFTDFAYGNKGTNQPARLERAWLGAGNIVKNRARTLMLDYATGDEKLSAVVERYEAEIKARENVETTAAQ